jgi:hypothetical protein
MVSHCNRSRINLCNCWTSVASRQVAELESTMVAVLKDVRQGAED